jgi:glucose dehydrogenase
MRILREIVMAAGWPGARGVSRLRAQGVLLCFLTLALACKPQASRSTGSRNVSVGQPPVAGDVVLSPDDGQWVRPAKDYASTRFSGLTEINAQNVKNLRPVVTFSTGVIRGHEAAPIVANNTMYVVTPYPNYVYALDLTKPGAPAKWTFQPKPLSAAQGVACCDVVNRGVVYDNGRIFMNTLDGRTIALDANTGKPVWDTKVAEINLGETITMAPLVVKGKVLVGDSGGEMGVRGWLKALDGSSGRVVWTAYHTGPDADVCSARFQAVSTRAIAARTSASAAGRRTPGRSAAERWGWISYDPGARPDLLWDGESRALESRHAARRQQVDEHLVRAPARQRRSRMGLPALPARPPRL